MVFFSSLHFCMSDIDKYIHSWDEEFEKLISFFEETKTAVSNKITDINKDWFSTSLDFSTNFEFLAEKFKAHLGLLINQLKTIAVIQPVEVFSNPRAMNTLQGLINGGDKAIVLFEKVYKTLVNGKVNLDELSNTIKMCDYFIDQNFDSIELLKELGFPPEAQNGTDWELFLD